MPPRPRRHLSAHPYSCQYALVGCSVAKLSNSRYANISGYRSAVHECSVATCSYGPSAPHKRRAAPASQLHSRHRHSQYPDTLMLMLLYCARFCHQSAAEPHVLMTMTSPFRLGSGAWSPGDPGSVAQPVRGGPVPDPDKSAEARGSPRATERTSRTSTTSSATPSRNRSFQISMAGLYLPPLFWTSIICFMHQPRGPPHIERRIPPSWGPEAKSNYSFIAWAIDINLWVAMTDLLPHQQSASINLLAKMKNLTSPESAVGTPQRRPPDNPG
jgi:hypothetical protein